MSGHENVQLRTQPDDPSQQPRTCEVCGTIQPQARMYSVALVYRHIPGVTAFQCGAEQHWGCSADHAEQAMMACYQQHIRPALAALEQQRDARAPAPTPAPASEGELPQ
jgi:hypothetical protein